MESAGTAVAPAGSGEEPTLTPVVPDCTHGKYYKPPPFLRPLRPKRKVAIVFGYIGEKYCGLQWNKKPDFPTVEEALLRALAETDMISAVNMASPKVQQLLNFERASRTDKGVHALRNVVSVCVMLPYSPAYVAQQGAGGGGGGVADEGEVEADGDGEGASEGRYSCSEAKRLLNLALPSDIHVYEVVPVTRSYNAYLNCGWRRYEYYLPTYCLMDRAAYCERFFPAALAPARPTLQDVGFEAADVEADGDAASADDGGVEDDNDNDNDKDDDDDSPRGTAPSEGGEEHEGGPGPSVGGTGGDNGYGRKSRGHFPMRKGKRARLRAEAAAREAAGGEATVAAPCAPSAVDVPAEQVGDEAPEQSRDGRSNPSTGARARDGLLENMILFRSIPEEHMRGVASGFRLSESQLARVRGLFSQFEGTRCYHNFTPGGSGRDPSCNRFLRRITVTEPFLVYPDGEEGADSGEAAAACADAEADPKAAVEKTHISSARIRESVDYWSPSRFYSPDDRVAEEYAAMWAAASAPLTGVGDGQADEDVRRRVEAEKVAVMRQTIFGHMKRVYGRQSCESGPPSGGIEVVRIEMEGQSFLLNQIRKMIGAVICCCATDSRPSLIQDTLLSRKVQRSIPMAPANGLFLSYLDFAGYNARLARIQANGANGGDKAGLYLDDVDARELVEWRARTVAVVLRNEMAEDLCGKWMRSLRCVLRLTWRVELP